MAIISILVEKVYLFNGYIRYTNSVEQFKQAERIQEQCINSSHLYVYYTLTEHIIGNVCTSTFLYNNLISRLCESSEMHTLRHIWVKLG